ncbi:MAG TPA: hypothetical protein VHG28_19775 [Longimicrobiaceae bacterium]|nr:hypothetical protein [Longimicrobiaceae bacterium]
MATRDVLQDWIVEALQSLGGQGRIMDVSKYIWHHHEPDLRHAGDLFYTWQYDMRWAAQKLRDAGKLKPAVKRDAAWELA